MVYDCTMVWFQLSELLKYLEPETDMKYVSFKTFYDTDAASNQKQNGILGLIRK